MSRSLSRGLFLLTLSVIGVVLAVAMYQVPQPWRGILIGWLLFFLSGGYFILRLLKHYFDYKSLKLTRQPMRQVTRSRPKRPAHSRFSGLKVIQARSGETGRYTIR